MILVSYLVEIFVREKREERREKREERREKIREKRKLRSPHRPELKK